MVPRMVQLPIIILLISTVFCAEAPLPVTITSNAGSVVCVKSTITLTCQATGATQFNWTTGDHSEVTNNNTDTITVTVTPEAIQYTCTATDSNGTTGTSNIVIAGNGSVPYLYFDNHPVFPVFEGTLVNITAGWSRNISVQTKWSRKNDNLPVSSNVVMFSVGNKNYSSLIIPNVTTKLEYDDSGTYIFTASNECGTSSVNTSLEIVTSDSCSSGKVPILGSTPNETTIRGEMVPYYCLFGGSFLPITQDLYAIGWKVNDEDLNVTVINNKPSQNCPHQNYSCCEFISEVKLNTSEVLREVLVTCYVIRFQDLSSSTSSLTVLEPPVLTHGPENATVEEHQTALLTCSFNSSEIQYLSVCSWSSENGEIYNNSVKYLITEEWVGSQMVCTLRIMNVTKTDELKYTCYCYYNGSFKLYLEKKHVIQSSLGEATLHVIGNKAHSDGNFWRYVAIGLLVMLPLSLLTFVTIIIFKWRRKKRYRRLVDLPNDHENICVEID